MSPEFGSTVAIFPIDDRTLEYLRLTGRPAEQIALVEAYAKAQRLFRSDATPDPEFVDSLALDLAEVEPSLAGPRRPQDRVPLPASSDRSRTRMLEWVRARERANDAISRFENEGGGGTATVDANAIDQVDDGSVVIAAITSCTNTSNPSVLIGAGLLARNAIERGLRTQIVGENIARPGLESRYRLPSESRAAGVSRPARVSTSSDTVARPASETRARCRATSRRRSPTAI